MRTPHLAALLLLPLAASSAVAQTRAASWPLTRPERTDYAETSRYDEVIAFMREMAARNPQIKLVAGGEEVFPGQPGTVVAVSGAFATKNPDAVQAVVNGLVKAAALIKTDPDKAAPHVAAALGKGIVDPALIRKALVSPASRFEIDPRKIIEPARAMQAYQVKLGSLDKEAPFDGLFETQYYERAVKAGG